MQGDRQVKPHSETPSVFHSFPRLLTFHAVLCSDASVSVYVCVRAARQCAGVFNTTMSLGRVPNLSQVRDAVVKSGVHVNL